MVNAFLVVVMAGDVFVGRKLVIPDSRPTPVTRPQCVRKRDEAADGGHPDTGRLEKLAAAPVQRLVGYFGTGDIGGRLTSMAFSLG
jgi:hypothetical protein